ncbi:MAG TPA: hypothetical protein VGD54_05660 [Steroidobacteraceae bacterium]
MRLAVLAAITALSACASDSVSLVPPRGVDFSGQWKLNDADSDSPLRLQQTANAQAADAGNNGDSGGRGRGGGRGGRGSQGVGSPGLRPPATPSMGALGEAVRFPGKQLEIKQVDGIVAFTSEGKNQVCQPGEAKKPRHRGSSSDRDAPLPAERDIPPPTCGWSDKILIVQGTDTDEDRAAFEERFSISEDGQRLVEEVSFRGGRSNGFTLSRVWDRVTQGCNYATDPTKCQIDKKEP